jgi:DNA polymerase III epsilon subunit-like protein
MEDWQLDWGLAAPAIFQLLALAGFTPEQAAQQLGITKEALYRACWRLGADPRIRAGISDLIGFFGFTHGMIWGQKPTITSRVWKIPAAFEGVPVFRGELVPGRHTLVLLADCETSGPDAERHRAVEVALLKVVLDRRPQTGYRLLGAIDGYVGLQDPGPHPVNSVSMRVHGIPMESLRGQVLDEGALFRVLAGAMNVIAHNAAFDRRFLTKAFPALMGLSWGCSYRGVDWKGFGCESANLKVLCKQFDLPHPRHRAAGDVAALYRLLECPMPDGRTAFSHLVGEATKQAGQD